MSSASDVSITRTISRARHVTCQLFRIVTAAMTPHRDDQRLIRNENDTPSTQPSDASGAPCRAHTGGIVTLAHALRGQAGLMRRGPARVPVPRSAFAGFRFPPDVIMIAVRWYQH